MNLFTFSRFHNIPRKSQCHWWAIVCLEQAHMLLMWSVGAPTLVTPTGSFIYNMNCNTTDWEWNEPWLQFPSVCLWLLHCLFTFSISPKPPSGNASRSESAVWLRKHCAGETGLALQNTAFPVVVGTQIEPWRRFPGDNFHMQNSRDVKQWATRSII